MSNRSWFFAADGKQQGPYPDPQFRDFIARRIVTAETLVWSEGMAGWQKAGDVPGLMSSASAASMLSPRVGGTTVAEGPAGMSLSFGAGPWSLLGRSLLYILGLLLVIPAPWAATAFYRWFVSHIDVPERPNLAFEGQVGDIWYVFVLLGLCSYAGLSPYNSIQLVVIPVQALLSWMILRWLAGNLSSNEQRLPIAFTGSALGYVGWYLLIFISFVTIIGWAWVVTAWMRWVCRNLSGTRREVLFNASGWSVLWRTLLASIACAFLIPIPWAMRWYARWYVSQFELAERDAHATA
jgi:hypothetical protein